MTPTKNIFFSKFLCLFLFEGTFILYFKDKKSQRSHKTVEIKVFLHFLLVDGMIRMQEAQKHTDPADTDPEHWLKVYNIPAELTFRKNEIGANLCGSLIVSVSKEQLQESGEHWHLLPFLNTGDPNHSNYKLIGVPRASDPYSFNTDPVTAF